MIRTSEFDEDVRYLGFRSRRWLQPDSGKELRCPYNFASEWNVAARCWF